MVRTTIRRRCGIGTPSPGPPSGGHPDSGCGMTGVSGREVVVGSRTVWIPGPSPFYPSRNTFGSFEVRWKILE